MKLIFLHGLGQSAESWKEVQGLLADYPSEILELFPSGVCSYEEAKKRVAKHLSEEKQPFFNRFISRCYSCTGAFKLRFTKSSSLGFVRLPSEISRKYFI